MSPSSSAAKNNPIKKPERSRACYLIHADFLLGLFFDTEEGGDMFLRDFR
jgi:hypothetical protein